MSLSTNVICVAVLLLVRSATCYKCFGSRCMCLDPIGCNTNCTNGFCQNKEFVCTEKVNHCSFQCHDIESCQDSRFYMASNEFYIDCASTNSCSNAEIYCGLPHNLPEQLTTEDFDGSMQTCGISASTASIQNSYISCNGNIENCYIESETNADRVISSATVLDSEFDCSISGKCTFNCSYGCYRSIYSCGTECECNGCNQTDGVYIERRSTTAFISSSSAYNISNTISVILDMDTIDGNDTDESDTKSKPPLFDLTDGTVSNLEILYYIIMSAGTCLICCICLCIFMICMARSSVIRDQDIKSNENSPKDSKSAASTYRIYGQNEGSPTVSNDSVLDLGSEQSSNDSSLQLSKPLKMRENDPSSIEYEDIDKITVSTHEVNMNRKVSNACLDSSDSSSQSEDMSDSDNNLNESEFKSRIQPPSTVIVHRIEEEEEEEEEADDEDEVLISPRSNLKIKLTKPQSHNERIQKRLEAIDDINYEDNNRLTPNSRRTKTIHYSPSPMSPLSGISSSNPDPDEGMCGHNMAAMYADSITSVDSSEVNLKIKSRPISEIDLMPQPNQLMSQQFEQMMSDYANVSRGRSATQYAVMKQQLLWIQQQNHESQGSGHACKRSYSGSTHSSNRVPRARVEMIKPSIHHCHTSTISHPTLPVIDSDGNNSSDDVITPSLREHATIASDQSSRISSSSSMDEESVSDEQSDASCSCSDCIRNEEDNTTHTKSHYLGNGTPCGSNGTGSSSSASSVCNDTQCSCQQCTASCVSSSDRDSSSSDTDSSRSDSDTSSSYTGSDNDTITTTTVLSEDFKKKLRKKRNKMDQYDAGSIDTIDTDLTPSAIMSYTRGDNRTMVIHEDMSTDTHSRQDTAHTAHSSNMSHALSTIRKAANAKDHGRMKTFVIHHNLGSVDSGY